MDYMKLQKRIHELAKEISYPCKKIDHLTYAMKLSTHPGHVFFHSGFEDVGRSLLNAINTHYLFTRGYNTEKEIEAAKEVYLNDKPYDTYSKEHELWKYVYNDHIFADEDPEGKLHPEGSDKILVERIIGAMYYDSDWETVKHFVITTLGIRRMKKTGSMTSTK